MYGGSGLKPAPVPEKKSFKSFMKEEQKVEPESINEAEFHALYKLGELPFFIDDLVQYLTGHRLPLFIANDATKKAEAEANSNGTKPLFPQ